MKLKIKILIETVFLKILENLDLWEIFAIRCIMQIHTHTSSRTCTHIHIHTQHAHAHTHPHVFPPMHHWGPPTFPPHTSLTHLPTHIPTSPNQLLHHPPLIIAPKMWQDIFHEEGLGSRNGGSKNKVNYTPDISDQTYIEWCIIGRMHTMRIMVNSCTSLSHFHSKHTPH